MEYDKIKQHIVTEYGLQSKQVWVVDGGTRPCVKLQRSGVFDTNTVYTILWSHLHTRYNVMCNEGAYFYDSDNIEETIRLLTIAMGIIESGVLNK